MCGWCPSKDPVRPEQCRSLFPKPVSGWSEAPYDKQGPLTEHAQQIKAGCKRCQDSTDDDISISDTGLFNIDTSFSSLRNYNTCILEIISNFKNKQQYAATGEIGATLEGSAYVSFTQKRRFHIIVHQNTSNRCTRGNSTYERNVHRYKSLVSDGTVSVTTLDHTDTWSKPVREIMTVQKAISYIESMY